MDCEHAIYRMYLYLDGELAAWRRWSVTRHLERCPPCQHGYHFELELREVVARCSAEPVPDALRERVSKALEGAPAADPGGPSSPAFDSRWRRRRLV